jgi:hypothetical protein
MSGVEASRIPPSIGLQTILALLDEWLNGDEKGTVDAQQVEDVLRRQDALGRRIHIVDVMDASALWLALLDQSDRALPDFLRVLTEELDRHGHSSDRRAFAQLLDRL